ncbi:MAG: response regulator [Bacteroidia bacterium]
MSRNKIILIIDDDEDDRSLFFDAVKEIDPDLKCISAVNGQDALTVLRSKGAALPDYIFLDLNMPRLNGKQCLAELKKDPRLSKIPVIIYSTSKRIEDVEETKKLGAENFITKPTLFREICDAIRSVIS